MHRKKKLMHWRQEDFVGIWVGGTGVELGTDGDVAESVAGESSVIGTPALPRAGWSEARRPLSEPQVHLVRASTSQGFCESREDNMCNRWCVPLYWVCLVTIAKPNRLVA